MSQPPVSKQDAATATEELRRRRRRGEQHISEQLPPAIQEIVTRQEAQERRTSLSALSSIPDHPSLSYLLHRGHRYSTQLLRERQRDQQQQLLQQRQQLVQLLLQEDYNDAENASAAAAIMALPPPPSSSSLTLSVPLNSSTTMMNTMSDSIRDDDPTSTFFLSSTRRLPLSRQRQGQRGQLGFGSRLQAAQRVLQDMVFIDPNDDEYQDNQYETSTDHDDVNEEQGITTSIHDVSSGAGGVFGGGENESMSSSLSSSDPQAHRMSRSSNNEEHDTNIRREPRNSESDSS